ncbi:hypothetical protein AB6A40_001574 [Gnathostoma spinigerum]|uniref:Uncharacterized protein n=1 Tax=Gnathostoma spinigerum TaxID=75299 RepID=A0ABD6EEV4_9BILA
MQAMRAAPIALSDEIISVYRQRTCGFHVQHLLLIHCPLTLVTSLVAIALAVVFYVYPELHHRFPVFKQVLQHYSRTKHLTYTSYYKIFLVSWICMHSVHILTLATTILGIKLIRSHLLLPELAVLILLTGVFTMAILCGITLSIVQDELMWMCSIISIFYLIVTATNLYLLVFTHRYVADRRNAIQRILAHSKSVKFEPKSPQ